MQQIITLSNRTTFTVNFDGYVTIDYDHSYLSDKTEIHSLRLPLEDVYKFVDECIDK
jgi:hypothetical protein